jgi:hypothetical protein
VDGKGSVGGGGQFSKKESSPIQRLPILRLAVGDSPIQDSSPSSPTDSAVANSPTSSFSSISKWSARGSDVTCASPTQDGVADIEPPPDGGYGWVCVLSCFLINAFSWGVVSVSYLPNSLLSPSFLLPTLIILALTLPVLRSLPGVLSLAPHLPHRNPNHLRPPWRPQLRHSHPFRAPPHNPHAPLRSPAPHPSRSSPPDLLSNPRLIRH